jgi:hypothetical protein
MNRWAAKKDITMDKQERRKSPVLRCPERAKDRIASASMKLLTKRLLAAKEREELKNGFSKQTDR